MATTAQMLAAGIAFVTNTFILIYSAWLGDKIFQPLYRWQLMIEYGQPPPIDPGLTLWIPRIYFGLLLVLWFALLYVLIMMVFTKNVNQYGG